MRQAATKCSNCGSPVEERNGKQRTVCSNRCRAILAAKARNAPEEPFVDWEGILAAKVRQESAPPWERHPVPWDNVSRRKP